MERSHRYQAQPEDAGSLLGDIYVGKVRNIVKNINAAFVEYEQGKMGYLSLDAKVCLYIRTVLYRTGQEYL